MKILHTADWHIGNFPGPSDDSNKNLRLEDIKNCIEELIAQAVNDVPDIIIIAGDVFHQAKVWAERGLNEVNLLAGYLRRLAAVAPVYLLRGTPNHDGKSQFDMLSTIFEDNDDVFIIDEPCVMKTASAAIAFAPIIDKNKVRAESDKPLDRTEETQLIAEKLSDMINELSAEAKNTGLPATVLVTHYTVTGSERPGGQLNIITDTEVCIDPLTLINADFDLVCLGHIHKKQKLSSCNNTFYAGSLLPLTFNDENEIHGFFMHDVDPFTKSVTSHFYEIESRKFITVNLNDASLNALIAADYDPSALIAKDAAQNNILRISYSCLDTTDKIFNKSLLEKRLYDEHEVFYVSEITPVNITVTVDKSAVPVNSDVVDNLAKFLLNEKEETHNITDVQINDCIETARPIIDTVMANTLTTQMKGVFEPVEISVKNYRNYRDATFSYKDIRFCVINGENGAGKSSLFMDAMLDALFENPRESEKTGWINNSEDAKSGSITFTFSIDGILYRIIRTRLKSGKASLNLSMYVPNDDTGEFEWTDISEEKMKDTQFDICELIGMDADTLRSCGLIMQDAYGLFLQADRTTRMTILGNILGLSFYDSMYDICHQGFKHCQEEITKYNAEQNEILNQMVNGEKTQEQLNECLTIKAQYEHDLQVYRDELASNLIRREGYIKDKETYTRIYNEVEAIKQKQRENCATIAEKQKDADEAQAVIDQEPDCLEARDRFNILTEQKNELEAKNVEISGLGKIRAKLEEDIKTTEGVITDAGEKVTRLTDLVTNIEINLAAAEDIRSKAELYQECKKEIETIESKLESIEKIKGFKTDSEHRLELLNADYERVKKMHQAQLDEIDRQQSIINDSGCPIHDSVPPCKFLASALEITGNKSKVITDHRIACSACEENIKNCQLQIDTYARNLTELTTDLPDINFKKQQLAVYEDCAFKNAALPEQAKQLDMYKEQLREFTAIKAENEEKLKKLKAQLEENTASITSLTLEVACLNDITYELDRLKVKASMFNRIAASKVRKENAEKRIAELEKENQLLDYDIQHKTEEYTRYDIDKLVLDDVNASIEACNAKIDLLSVNITENGKLIGQFEADMKRYENDCLKLNRLRTLLNQTSYVASNYSWLKKAFTRTGIPHNIIRSVIPLLERTATAILGQMSNNKMSVELITERTLSNKSEVATLDIAINDINTGCLPYMSRSGGERVQASLAVILALAEIKSTQNGVKLGFLFIDEPPFLDNRSAEAYCDALLTIRVRYPDLKIIAITHDQAMKAKFNQSIDVFKTPNGSAYSANL